MQEKLRAKKKGFLTLRIDQSIVDRMRVVAERRRLIPSELIRRALEQYLKQAEK